MRNWFQFGNIKFDINDGTPIEKVPNQNRPARKMDVYSVPGRSGDIVVMQDAWENVSQTYEIWGGSGAINDATTFGYKCAELFKLSGYQELTDSYDTTHYRKAYFAGPFDVENEFTRRGRATLTFNCDPRRFLNSGKAWINITKWIYGQPQTEIVNPTAFPGAPIFDVTCTTNLCRIIWGDKSLTIHDPGTYVIDCGNETIVDSNGDPAFNSVTGEFPKLGVGTTYISFDDPGANPVTCKMQPNWWTL